MIPHITIRLATVVFATLTAALVTACSSPPPPAPRVVDLKSADGVALKATLFPSATRGPAVLLLHQCDEQRKVWDSLGVRLMKAGITALAVDNRGYGESGGSDHLKLPPAEQAAMLRDKWPIDFDTAFAFLSRQENVDTARMAAGGGSCGANNATQLAMRHANVKALALLAGGVDREGRAFLETPNAPPVLTGAAGDDKYANFVDIMSWFRGLSTNSASRAITYKDGGHAAVVFNAHPDFADSIAKWYQAVLFNKPEMLPNTNGSGMSADVMKALHDIDQPGGAAKVGTQLAELRKQNPTAQLFPEYYANILGYEHQQQMNDNAGAIEIMKLNVMAYPDSPNAMDSLGDVYLAAGDNKAALDCAKKTLVMLEKDTVDTAERKKSIRDSAEGKIKELTGKER